MSVAGPLHTQNNSIRKSCEIRELFILGIEPAIIVFSVIRRTPGYCYLYLYYRWY